MFLTISEQNSNLIRVGDIIMEHDRTNKEMRKPRTFEAVARGYLGYFDEDIARQIYEPEAYAAAEADHADHLKETADQGTHTSF